MNIRSGTNRKKSSSTHNFHFFQTRASVCKMSGPAWLSLRSVHFCKTDTVSREESQYAWEKQLLFFWYWFQIFIVLYLRLLKLSLQVTFLYQRHLTEFVQGLNFILLWTYFTKLNTRKCKVLLKQISISFLKEKDFRKILSSQRCVLKMKICSQAITK